MKDLCLTSQDLALALNVSVQEIYEKIKQVESSPRSLTYIAPETARKILQNSGRELSRRVISFQMLKGGVAKTTSAFHFGWRASMYGAKVLFIDLDQQANLTFSLTAGLKMDTENLPVWVDLLEKKVSIQDLIVPLPGGIDLIPSSLNNSVLERVLMNSQRNWSKAVRQHLHEIKERYDLIIIDTAPSLSLINTAVTCASDEVILPINPDKFSVLGVEKHLKDLKELQQEFGLNLKSRILLTRFDSREALSHEILTRSIDQFEDLLMKHYIRASAEIKNAVGAKRSLFAAKSKAKEDYDLMTRELLGWI